MSDTIVRGAAAMGRWWGTLVYRAPDERDSCPACDGVNVTLLDLLPLARRTDRNRVGFIAGCRTCGLLFANPFPSLEALQEFYSPDGEFRRRREDDAAPKPLAGNYLKDFFAPVAGQLDIQQPPPGGRALDIGCGNGRILDALQQHGWSTWGIEPSGDLAFARHQRLEAIPADGTFDVVILHHVLEHVGRPLELLRAAAAALRAGGVLAASVPRLDALPLTGDLRYCINSHTHIVSYSRDSMLTLLGMAGLEGIHVSPPIDQPQPKAYMLRRLQVLGVKSGRPGETLHDPLDGARRALAAYRRQHGGAEYAALPIRVRAARLNRQRIEAARAGQGAKPRL